MYKIMIVDDEKDIVFMLSEFMKANDIEVIKAYSAHEALIKLDDTIQLIILDINMPKLNGLEVCKHIRMTSNVPILFLTANASQYDKVVGFGIGADDYITKPFDPVELVARTKAHLRRYENYSLFHSGSSKPIKFGDITIFRNAHKVLKGDTEISLSSTEFNLLLFLIDNSQTVLTRKQILMKVWETTQYDENTVNTFIKRLREKIEENREAPKYIKSVRGVGYIFDYDFTG